MFESKALTVEGTFKPKRYENHNHGGFELYILAAEHSNLNILSIISAVKTFVCDVQTRLESSKND